MTPRNITHSTKARDALVRGANTLARAVGATLGPSGRIVLIDDRFGRVVATKDGVTVAKAVHLPNQEEQMGASLLRDAAIKVAETCGDGTTTCVVMAAKLLEEATKLVHGGADLVKLVREIEDAAGCAENLIMSRSQPAIGVGWDQRIANVSGNHDPRVTQSVALAFDHVGANGSISIRDGNTDRIEVDRQEGFRIERGHFAAGLTPESGLIELEDALVLITNRTLTSGVELIPILQAAAAANLSLLIVCDGLVGEALETVTGNHRAGSIRVAAVRAPGFEGRQWDMLHDLAVWCDAEVQDIATGRLDAAKLGAVANVTQDRSRTILRNPIGQNVPALTSRIKNLESVRDTTSNEYDLDKAIERIGRLRGRVVEIRVGAPTETEAREIKDRIEDALHAVRIAHRDGVQPGGGTALLRAAHWLEMKQTLGAQAVRTALREPAAKIARNAGTPEHLAPMTVAIDLSWNTGCTADGEPVDMMQFPDPTAVVVGALRAAVSVVTTLLLAETSITIEERR